MKTELMTVTGTEIARVLDLVDRAAANRALAPRDAMHLRLLAEEALGMLRAITGEKKADFWLEDKPGRWEMHLRMHTQMNDKKKQQLLSASSRGVNEATRTLMGKIRAFFEPDGSVPMLLRAEVVADAPADASGCLFWSLSDYRQELSSCMEEDPYLEELTQAWDELEKSVVAHVADDIRVYIHGGTVEMTLLKKTA